MKAKSQKIIYRLKHACLVNCYDAWLSIVNAEHVLRSDLKKLLSKLLFAELHWGFENWLDAIALQAQNQETMRRLLFRITSGYTSRCFHNWQYFALESVLRKEAIAEASFKVMFRIWRRWQAFAFREWIAYIVAQQERMFKARRHVLKILKSGVTRLFARWLSMTHEVRCCCCILILVHSEPMQVVMSGIFSTASPWMGSL